MIIAAFFLILAVSHPSFLTTGNLFATGTGMAGILIVTVGMTIALIGGGFDLSVGGVVALTGVTMMVLVEIVPAPIALVVAIGAGVVVGLLNGFLIAKVGTRPFAPRLCPSRNSRPTRTAPCQPREVADAVAAPERSGGAPLSGLSQLSVVLSPCSEEQNLAVGVMFYRSPMEMLATLNSNAR